MSIIPARTPPRKKSSAQGWLSENLFSTPANTLLTLLLCYGLYTVIPPLWQWAVTDAQWFAADSSACVGKGACWAFITARIDQFIYGFYPPAERWRGDLFFLQLAIVTVWLVLPRARAKGLVLTYALLVMPVLSWLLLYGGFLGLEKVPSHYWGGLMLTLLLALVGMIASLPLGVLLALGRRSSLLVVRSLSTAYIELWRGVPLITVLFMASVMLPLFVPENVVFDKLLRALIGIVLFQGAYMAEVVRGGLQAIPRGQFEAFARGC